MDNNFGNMIASLVPKIGMAKNKNYNRIIGGGKK